LNPIQYQYKYLEFEMASILNKNWINWDWLGVQLSNRKRGSTYTATGRSYRAVAARWQFHLLLLCRSADF